MSIGWLFKNNIAVNQIGKAIEAEAVVAAGVRREVRGVVQDRVRTNCLHSNLSTADSLSRASLRGPDGKSPSQRSCSAVSFAAVICQGRPEATRKTILTSGSHAMPVHTWMESIIAPGSTLASLGYPKESSAHSLLRTSAIK